MMKSIFVGTPGAFGRDVRPKLGFAILCEQRAIKMTTEIDLVSRAEFQWDGAQASPHGPIQKR